MNKPVCVHCKERVGTKPRGLCNNCYTQPHIRTMYKRRFRYREENVADLDKMIAEQMEDLPPWWQSENVRNDDPKEEYQRRVVKVISRRRPFYSTRGY